MDYETGLKILNSVNVIAATKEGLKIIAKTGVTTSVSELVKALINKHFKPNIKSYKDYKADYEILEDYISEYLIISYNKNITMNTIVFRGQQKMLFDLYIPLTVVKNDNVDSEDGDEYIIVDGCFNFVDEYSKVLIVDTAGMGKSTIVKYMAIQSININKFIPIIIELRKLSADTDIVDYLVEQLELIDKKLEKNDVNKMLKRGDFIIFFDGYDEIIEDNKQKVTDHIQEFIYKAGNNKYVLTSREESNLNCFGDFQRFSIKPLQMDEAFELIRKYDNHGKLSEKLINRIQQDNQLVALKEFLTNPMLVSLLYKTFEYKEEITYKKIGFYVQVYEALFNDHDKTKGGAYVHPKKSSLDSYEFERMLRGIAFFSLQKNRVEFNKNEILDIIEKVINKLPWIKVQGILFLDDIIHAVPLFQNDGNDYKWVHKSFMEYFAAGYICYECKDKTEELIRNMINSSNNKRYINVLDFCYDMKPDIARRIIVYNFLSEFIEHYNSVYSNPYFKKINPELLNFRKSTDFTNEYAVFQFKTSKDSNNKFKDINFMKNLFNDTGFNDFEFISRSDFNSKQLLIVGNKQYKIIEHLLRNKGIDIFESINSKIVKKAKDKREKIDEGIYHVNDDIENIINKGNNLEYYTKYVKDFVHFNKIIDYDKCVSLKNRIDKEIDELMNDDIYLT